MLLVLLLLVCFPYAFALCQAVCVVMFFILTYDIAALQAAYGTSESSVSLTINGVSYIIDFTTRNQVSHLLQNGVRVYVCLFVTMYNILNAS